MCLKVSPAECFDIGKRHLILLNEVSLRRDVKYIGHHGTAHLGLGDTLLLYSAEQYPNILSLLEGIAMMVFYSHLFIVML